MNEFRQSDQLILTNPTSFNDPDYNLTSFNSPNNNDNITKLSKKNRYSLELDSYKSSSSFSLSEIKLRSSTNPMKLSVYQSQQQSRPQSLAITSNVDLSLNHLKSKLQQGLFSSFRRKFELIQLKKRVRKSLPQSFHQINSLNLKDEANRGRRSCSSSSSSMSFGWDQLDIIGLKYLSKNGVQNPNLNDLKSPMGNKIVRSDREFLVEFNNLVKNSLIDHSNSSQTDLFIQGKLMVSI